jgi:pimeloyl-ACP methyl ester carboxylesterase
MGIREEDNRTEPLVIQRRLDVAHLTASAASFTLATVPVVGDITITGKVDGSTVPYATSTDGVHIFYTTTGEGDALVLSHGGTHTWESWQDLGYVDALKDRFHLILIDTRGHGDSDKPHNAAAYTMPQQVDDVVAVLNDVGIDRFHFWGYSIGAQISFHVASRLPERVKSFVAYGGHPYPPSPDDLAFNDELTATLRKGMQAWVDRMEARGVFTQYPNPEVRRKRLLAADADALIAMNMAYADDPGIADGLSRITMPGLLIAGQHDGVNNLARQAANTLAIADFVSVGGIGHAIVHAQTILPYVRAFYERFGSTAGASDSAGH